MSDRHEEEDIAGELLAEEAPELPSLKLQPGEVLRIEETVYASWGGVSGCCDQNTVDAEWRAAFQRWVKEKLFQYRHLRWIRYGQVSNATGKCSRSGGDWGSARRCRASLSAPCFIEFRQV